MSLLNLYRGVNVYYTNDWYYSSYPFPSEWIELFNAGGYNDVANGNISYAPVISQREFISIREKYNKQKRNHTHHTLEERRRAIPDNLKPYQFAAKKIKRHISENKKPYKRRMTNYEFNTDQVQNELVNEIKTWAKPDKKLMTRDLSFGMNITHDSFMKLYRQAFNRSGYWKENYWSQLSLSNMTTSHPRRRNISVRSYYTETLNNL